MKKDGKTLAHVTDGGVYDNTGMEPIWNTNKVVLVSDAGTPFDFKVPRWFGALDLLVVPSVWYENTPFVILESLAAGTPVIASDLGGLSELIEVGRNGFVFKAGDSADLREKLARFVEEAQIGNVESVEGLRSRYLRAVAWNPQFERRIRRTDERLVEALRECGETMTRHGKRREAKACLDAGIAIDPDNGDIFVSGFADGSIQKISTSSDASGPASDSSGIGVRVAPAAIAAWKSLTAAPEISARVRTGSGPNGNTSGSPPVTPCTRAARSAWDTTAANPGMSS